MGLLKRPMEELRGGAVFNSGDLQRISDGKVRTLSGWIQEILGKQEKGKMRKRWVSRKDLLAFFLQDAKVKIILFLLGISHREKKLILCPKGMAENIAAEFPQYDVEETETAFELGAKIRDPRLVLIVKGGGLPSPDEIHKERVGIPVILVTKGIEISIEYREDQTTGDLQLNKNEISGYAAQVTVMEENTDQGFARLFDTINFVLSKQSPD